MSGLTRRIVQFAAAAVIYAGSILAQPPAASQAKGKVNPNGAQAQVERARSLLRGGQDDKAMVCLNRAIQVAGKTPQAAYAHYLRAKVYTKRNNIHQAKVELQRAVALEPEFAAAWSDLGQARKSLSDKAGALAAYERAVRLDPKDPVAQYRLGAEDLHLKKTHLAVQHLKEALSLSPDNQSALYNLQLALRQEGKAVEAEKVKKELAALLHRRDVLYRNSLKAVVMNDQGASLQKSGDLQGALEKYRAALKLSPGQVKIRVNFAVALLRLGHWNQGLSELHKAMQQDPGNDRLRRAWKDAVSQAPAGTLVDGIPLQSFVARQSP